MEGLCCSDRIAKGKGGKKKREEISSLSTHGQSTQGTLTVGAQLLHGPEPLVAGTCG